jgi:hypothetical protein
MLNSLKTINNDFVGTFVIDKDTVYCTNNSINGQLVDDSLLVIKSWGNYLFVNQKKQDYFRLTVAKISKTFNEETISLIFPNSKYFDLKDNFYNADSLTIDSINKSIQLSYKNPFDIKYSIDSSNVYIESINFNQLQQLLNSDQTITQNVKRIAE